MLVSFACVLAIGCENGPTYAHLAAEYLKQHSIDVQKAFREVKGLGSDTPVVVIVKNSEHFSKAAQKTEKGSPFSHTTREGWEKGFIALGSLQGILSEAAGAKILPANGPHGFAAGKGAFVVTSVSELLVIDPNTGSVRERFTDPRFKNLHTVTFDPNNSDRVLLSCSGSERLLEFDLREKKVVWEWDAREHGYAENRSGVRFIQSGNPVPSDARKLSPEEAKAMMDTQHFVPPGKFWYVEIDKDHIPDDPLGLPKWSRTAFPNWSSYGEEPNTILASLFTPGHAAKIDRTTGKVQVVAAGLDRPHGLVATPEGYVISDTGNGKVVLMNSQHRLQAVYDFSQLPVQPDDLGREWLQHTNPDRERPSGHRGRPPKHRHRVGHEAGDLQHLPLQARMARANGGEPQGKRVSCLRTRTEVTLRV